MTGLKVRHNPELVDLFAVELFEETLSRMVDVLARGDCTADHEDVCAGLECVLDHVHADAACGPTRSLPPAAFLSADPTVDQLFPYASRKISRGMPACVHMVIRVDPLIVS